MKTAAVTMALLCWAAAANVMAADHRVDIDGMAFTPKAVNVRPGDTITWVNKDMFVHNVTAAAAGVRSGDLKPGQSWRHTVRQGESFDYLCTLHPMMTGRVEVEKITPPRRRSTS
jgi:plastocyanin